MSVKQQILIPLTVSLVSFCGYWLFQNIATVDDIEDLKKHSNVQYIEVMLSHKELELHILDDSAPLTAEQQRRYDRVKRRIDDLDKKRNELLNL